jgi:hypothetical protein
LTATPADSDHPRRQRVTGSWDWIDLVAAILRGQPSLDGGLCRDQPALFDADGDTQAAQALCRRCPVLARCAEWASGCPTGALSGCVAGVVHGNDADAAGSATPAPSVSAERQARVKVLAGPGHDWTQTDIAAALHVSQSSIANDIRLLRNSGELPAAAPSRKAGRSRAAP